MADSLRDQLLKSGLVQKLKAEAKPADRVQRPPNKPRPGARNAKPANPGATRSQEEMDLARAYGLRDRAEREQRELEKKQAEQRAKEKRERRNKLATLLNGAGQNAADADIPVCPP